MFVEVSVIETGTSPKPVALIIEGNERDQQHVGHDVDCVGSRWRHRNAERASDEVVARMPHTKRHLLVLERDRRAISSSSGVRHRQRASQTQSSVVPDHRIESWFAIVTDKRPDGCAVSKVHRAQVRSEQPLGVNALRVLDRSTSRASVAAQRSALNLAS